MAIKYSQPQSPIKRVDEKTGDIEYIYPQTVAKQVIMEDGTRLNAYLNKLVIGGGGSGGSGSGGGGGVTSLEELGVLATSAELNYLIGVEGYVQDQLDNKANSTHIHPIEQVTGLSDALNNKVPTDRTINKKSLTSDIVLSADDVGAYSKTEIDNKLSNLDMITVDTDDAIETNIHSGINADTFCGYPIDYFVMYNVGDGDGVTGGGGNVSINLNGTEEVGEIVPINADTLKGQTAGYYKTAYNLLDNSDFRNPVNQRGATTYTAAGYCIDRWYKGSNMTIAIQNDRIAINNTDASTHAIYQRLQNVSTGKKYTIALKSGTDKLYIGTGEFPTTGSVTVGQIATTGYMQFYYVSEGVYAVYINAYAGNSFGIKWIALYEGEYTAETLPEYIPKGYAHELLECQRYCYVMPEIDGAHCYPGFSDSATNARITINLPVALRSIPTISIGNNSENNEVYTSSGSKKITSISVRGNDRNGLVLNCTTSGLTAWSNCTARFMSMIISADL